MNCPLKQDKQCDEKQCAFWLVLYRREPDGKSIEEEKCAIVWIPFLMTELRGSIEGLRTNSKHKEPEESAHENVN